MSHPFTHAVFEYLHRVAPELALVYEPKYNAFRDAEVCELRQQSLFWTQILVNLDVVEKIPALLDWYRYDDWMTDFSVNVVPLLKRYRGGTQWLQPNSK